MPRVETEFARAGYCVIRRMLPEAIRAFLHDYARKAAQSGRLSAGDTQLPDTPSRYADPFMESVLHTMLPKVADTCGLRLFPTYSYFRVYKHGDILAPHVDRPSCEVSVTISVGYEAEAPWPVWIEQHGSPTAIELEPGDGMLYRGTQVRHWRDAFSGTEATQLFLHYVDRDGPNCDWKFDRRPALGNSAATDAILDKLNRQAVIG